MEVRSWAALSSIYYTLFRPRVGADARFRNDLCPGIADRMRAGLQSPRRENKHTGGEATDDGPRINAAMAGASASNPITLIIDGSALISGLFLAGGRVLEHRRAGLRHGVLRQVGHQQRRHPQWRTNAANAVRSRDRLPQHEEASVSLRNFTLNGNQGHGS